MELHHRTHVTKNGSYFCSGPKVQRDVLSRGICTSTADLARKLRRYIKAYAKEGQAVLLEVLRPDAADSSWQTYFQDSPLDSLNKDHLHS